nr:regulatory-associated protein of TOR 1 [Tanacetum cinerariifolium]
DEVTAKNSERDKVALQHITKCQHSSGSNLHNPIASWDTKFETGAKTALLQPSSPIVVAADEGECIRIWLSYWGGWEHSVLVNLTSIILDLLSWGSN